MNARSDEYKSECNACNQPSRKLPLTTDELAVERDVERHEMFSHFSGAISAESVQR